MRKAIFANGSKKITLLIPNEMYRWLQEQAESQGIEISRVIRNCIRYVIEMEDKRDESQ